MQPQPIVKVAILVSSDYIGVLNQIFTELGCDVTILEDTSALEKHISTEKPDVIMVAPNVEEWKALRIMREHLFALKAQDTYVCYFLHRDNGSTVRDLIHEIDNQHMSYILTPFGFMGTKYQIFHNIIRKKRKSCIRTPSVYI